MDDKTSVLNRHHIAVKYQIYPKVESHEKFLLIKF